MRSSSESSINNLNLLITQFERINKNIELDKLKMSCHIVKVNK